MAPAARRTVPVLVALLAVLVPLVTAVAGAVIWQGYRKSTQAAMDAGRQLFLSLQTEIAVQQQAMFEPLRFLISTFTDDPEFGAGAAERYLGPFTTVLERYPHVSSFRVGYDTGELFEVTALRAGNPGPAVAVMAPEGAAFAVRVIARTADAANRRETWRFLAADRTELARRDIAAAAEDPRTRLWYRIAAAAPGVLVESQPYVFSVIDQPGISVSKAFAGRRAGVLAADVTLAQMSALVGGLAAAADEQLFLFFGDGQLIAHPEPDAVFGAGPWDPDRPLVLPDIGSLTDPVAQAMVARFRATGPFGIDTLRVAGVPYLATVVQLGRSPVHMALALPEKNFTGVFDAIGRDGALISLGILLLSIPLIVVVARRFAHPLALLAQETDRIAQFDLRVGSAPATRIAELARLGHSMERMKAALGQISKFVPKSLVQDLVRSGAAMEVGGERRRISVLFTDVKDFTTLAESLPAEELMAQMSAYFDVVVRAVLAHGGTVDKYVGDAMFAFWNAPTRQAGHEVMALRAALAVQAASNALNRIWRADGKPVWFTRIGVHAGDAVVGNVGSADRLDYTAIGDTVNMGSRLEGLNKIYGTQVLASGSIAAAATAHFVFRPLDTVIPKGALNPVEIFELLGERTHDDAPAARLCTRWHPVMQALRARDWAAARAALEDFRAAYPEDGPARVVAERIARRLAEPSAESWDGITRYDDK